MEGLGKFNFLSFVLGKIKSKASTTAPPHPSHALLALDSIRLYSIRKGHVFLKDVSFKCGRIILNLRRERGRWGRVWENISASL